MIDIDKNRELTNKYGVRSIPRMYILSPEGENIGQVSKRDAQGFIENIKELTKNSEEEEEKETDEKNKEEGNSELRWFDNYVKAKEKAKEEKKHLLVHFTKNER